MVVECSIGSRESGFVQDAVQNQGVQNDWPLGAEGNATWNNDSVVDCQKEEAGIPNSNTEEHFDLIGCCRHDLWMKLRKSTANCI
ncbi:hypothetical protein Tco_0676930 [Tanacetum coccineum]